MVWLAVLLTAAASDPAKLNAEAKAAFHAKQFAKAAKLFEASASATGKGEAWYNAGLSFFKASQPANAMRAYTQALETGGVRASHLPELNRRMTELRGKVAELRLVVPTGCEVSIDSVASLNRVWLEPGLHQVLGTCQSDEIRRETLTLVGGEFREIRLDAPTVISPPLTVGAEPGPSDVPVKTVLVPAIADPPVVVVKEAPRAKPWLVVGIVSGVLAVGGGVVSWLLHGQMNSTSERFAAGERVDVMLAQRGRAEQVGFGVALSAAISLAVFAVTSFVVHVAAP